MYWKLAFTRDFARIFFVRSLITYLHIHPSALSIVRKLSSSLNNDERRNNIYDNSNFISEILNVFFLIIKHLKHYSHKIVMTLISSVNVKIQFRKLKHSKTFKYWPNSFDPWFSYVDSSSRRHSPNAIGNMWWNERERERVMTDNNTIKLYYLLKFIIN